MPHLTADRAQIDAMIGALQEIAADAADKNDRAGRAIGILTELRAADANGPARDPSTLEAMSNARFTELWNSIIVEVNNIAGRKVVASPTPPSLTPAPQGAGNQ